MVDPGSVFSLLTNIIELSKKSEEHNDELKELSQNSTILLSLLKELDTTDVLSESMKGDILKDLEEANKLLESPEITRFSQKLLLGVMAFLPGNKTSQLKEKNEKIFRHIQRIKALVDVKITKGTLTTSVIFQKKSQSNPDPELNLNKTTRQNSEENEGLPTCHTLKRTKTENIENLQIFEPTINENLLVAPTLNQNQYEGDIVYEITWEGDKNIFQQYLLDNKDFTITESLKFHEVKEQLIKDTKANMKEIYSVGRGKFMNLIKDKSENVKSFLNLISGNHLKLFLQKITLHINVENNTNEEKNDKNFKNEENFKSAEKGTIFFTCDDGQGGNPFEEIKKDSEFHYDFEFYVQDTSTNGSYILKKKNYSKKDAWERLPPKQNQLLEDGDKIGIVMDTKTHQILLLGFSFRKIQF